MRISIILETTDKFLKKNTKIKKFNKQDASTMQLRKNHRPHFAQMIQNPSIRPKGMAITRTM